MKIDPELSRFFFCGHPVRGQSPHLIVGGFGGFKPGPVNGRHQKLRTPRAGMVKKPVRQGIMPGIKSVQAVDDAFIVNNFFTHIQQIPGSDRVSRDTMQCIGIFLKAGGKKVNLHAINESTTALRSSAILMIRALPEKENRSVATGLRKISWEMG